MKRDFFILADTATLKEGNKLEILGAIVTKIEAERFPASVPIFYAVIRLLVDADDDDADEPHRIALRFVDAVGEQRAETPFLTIPASDLPGIEDHLDEERSIVVIVELSGMRFDMPGVHRIQLVVNGEVLDERSVFLAEGNNEVTEHAEKPRDSASAEATDTS